MERKLFVCGLGDDMDDSGLRALFDKYGVEHTYVVKDRQTGASRGFGFVTLSQSCNLQRAIDEMDNKTVPDPGGRRIKVSIAQDRSQKTGGEWAKGKSEMSFSDARDSKKRSLQSQHVSSESNEEQLLSKRMRQEGFTEADQEDLARQAEAQKRSRANRVGLGFSERDDEMADTNSGSVGNRGWAQGGKGEGGTANIQLEAARHYNSRSDVGRRLNSKLKTLQQKNLNNWVKAILISSAVKPGYSILDLACGKGGDLPKWSEQEIGHYVGIDIAYCSIKDAINRYNGDSYRGVFCKFQAKWCAGNFVNPHLFDKLDQAVPGICFDAVSCQFAIHYSWTSETDAENALRNAAMRLKKNGLFIGTTTDANVLVRKLQAADGLSFGNSLYNVEFICEDGQDAASFDKTFAGRSPFGIRYRFSLQDAVDGCEECLVHFPTMKALARKVGLEVVEEMNLVDFFERAATKSSKKDKYVDMLKRMKVLDSSNTISPDQWEVVYLYKTFVMKKIEDVPEKILRAKWQIPPRSHAAVAVDDILILTPDCQPP